MASGQVFTNFGFDSAGKYEREIPLPFDVANLIPLAYINGAFYFQLDHFDSDSDPDNGLCGEFSIIDAPSDILLFREGSNALKPISTGRARGDYRWKNLYVDG
jgi:hypothetical protein